MGPPKRSLDHSAPGDSSTKISVPAIRRIQAGTRDRPFPAAHLDTRLIYGDLPGVVTAPKTDRASILRAYAFVHLEEEMRRETLIKDWVAFVRFLRLAARESGQVLNYAAISNETGISQPTVKGYASSSKTCSSAFACPPGPTETRDLDGNPLLDLDAQANIRSITIEHASQRADAPQFSYEQVAA